MDTPKVTAGKPFPKVVVKSLSGEELPFGTPRGEADWRLAIVYRGAHCPLCTKFLNSLEGYRERLLKIGIAMDVASGDSKEQLEQHLEKLEVNFPISYGLDLEEMKSLGLYISYPRSEQETDHPFPEPGLFVVNAEGNVQVVDISNNPFVRPDLEAFVSGLEWIRGHDYPIRGTYPYSGF